MTILMIAFVLASAAGAAAKDAWQQTAFARTGCQGLASAYFPNQQVPGFAQKALAKAKKQLAKAPKAYRLTKAEKTSSAAFDQWLARVVPLCEELLGADDYYFKNAVWPAGTKTSTTTSAPAGPTATSTATTATPGSTTSPASTATATTLRP